MLNVALQLSQQVNCCVFVAIGSGKGVDRTPGDKLKSDPVDILVPTNGRLLILLQAYSIDAWFCKHVITDEADTMFDVWLNPVL